MHKRALQDGQDVVHVRGRAQHAEVADRFFDIGVHCPQIDLPKIRRMFQFGRTSIVKKGLVGSGHGSLGKYTSSIDGKFDSIEEARPTLILAKLKPNVRLVAIPNGGQQVHDTTRPKFRNHPGVKGHVTIALIRKFRVITLQTEGIIPVFLPAKVCVSDISFELLPGLLGGGMHLVNDGQVTIERQQLFVREVLLHEGRAHGIEQIVLGCHDTGVLVFLVFLTRRTHHFPLEEGIQEFVKAKRRGGGKAPDVMEPVCPLGRVTIALEVAREKKGITYRHRLVAVRTGRVFQQRQQLFVGVVLPHKGGSQCHLV